MFACRNKDPTCEDSDQLSQVMFLLLNVCRTKDPTCEDSGQQSQVMFLLLNVCRTKDPQREESAQLVSEQKKTSGHLLE
jgi:hypothetical protein